MQKSVLRLQAMAQLKLELAAAKMTAMTAEDERDAAQRLVSRLQQSQSSSAASKVCQGWQLLISYGTSGDVGRTALLLVMEVIQFPPSRCLSSLIRQVDAGLLRVMAALDHSIVAAHQTVQCLEAAGLQQVMAVGHITAYPVHQALLCLQAAEGGAGNGGQPDDELVAIIKTQSTKLQVLQERLHVLEASEASLKAAASLHEQRLAAAQQEAADRAQAAAALANDVARAEVGHIAVVQG